MCFPKVTGSSFYHVFQSSVSHAFDGMDPFFYFYLNCLLHFPRFLIFEYSFVCVQLAGVKVTNYTYSRRCNSATDTAVCCATFYKLCKTWWWQRFTVFTDLGGCQARAQIKMLPWGQLVILHGSISGKRNKNVSNVSYSQLVSSAEEVRHKKNPDVCFQTLGQMNRSLEHCVVLLLEHFPTTCSPALAPGGCEDSCNMEKKIGRQKVWYTILKHLR